jgi:hypothetical protein
MDRSVAVNLRFSSLRTLTGIVPIWGPCCVRKFECKIEFQCDAKASAGYFDPRYLAPCVGNNIYRDAGSGLVLY